MLKSASTAVEMSSQRKLAAGKQQTHDSDRNESQQSAELVQPQRKSPALQGTTALHSAKLTANYPFQPRMRRFMRARS